MPTANQKQTKIAVLERQLVRMDERIAKQEKVIETEKAALAALHEERERRLKRLEWQRSEPVSGDEEEPQDAN